MARSTIVLIGGASGVGTSTIAREVARRLDITHLIETDHLREVLRGAIDKKYAPVLHMSSYNAYRALRIPDHMVPKKFRDRVIAGFVEHASMVKPAIDMVIKRAVEDASDLVIEGVHLVPGLVHPENYQYADVHMVILYADEEEHRERFVKRAMEKGRGGRHLEYFRQIRIIHDFLLEAADEHGIPTIKNDDIDRTVSEVLSVVRSVSVVIKSVHNLEDSIREAEIIRENNCRLINIGFPIPGKRDVIKVSFRRDPVDEWEEILNNEESQQYFKHLYSASNNVHYHKISAPDEGSLHRAIEKLRMEGFKVEELRSGDVREVGKEDREG
ncbi:AAA family ATPase [Methanopyrus sp.]